MSTTSLPFSQGHERVYLVPLVLPFCSCNLDLNPMSLICELDQDILKIYITCEPKVKFRGWLSKIRAT